jgi:squalene synthase HpnC
MKLAPELEQAYSYCRQRVHDHYENFPVASWLLPSRLRNPVAAIYCFARTADDIADEGDARPNERLDKLGAMAENLEVISQGNTPDGVLYIAIADTIRTHSLSIQLFHDLLTAFRQDVTKTRYADFSEVLDYCHCSANPVGRLLLQLFEAEGPENTKCSDSICSALQLVNFLQDIQQDFTENGRIYLPLDELRQFNVNENDISQGIDNPNTRQLLTYQIARATEMLKEGVPLTLRLPGRIGLELRMILLGGLRILHKMRTQPDNFLGRPRLTTGDWIWMFWNAAAKSFPLN